MTIRPTPSNEHSQSPFEFLPLELKKDIAKRVGSVVEEAEKIPPGNPSQSEVAKAKSDAARYLANLSVVNQDFHTLTKQVMQELPEVEMAATSMAIRNIKQDIQFREKIVRLIRRHKHIEVPFRSLSPDNQKITLKELARAEITKHLEVVKLDLSRVKLDSDPQQSPNREESSTGVSRSPWKLAWLLGKIFKNDRYADIPDESDESNESVFQHLLTAIHAMSQHNSQFPNLELNLSGASLHDEGAIALARILPQCKVRGLCLRANNIGESGGIALAHALSRCTLTELDLSYNYDMGEGAVVALAKALPLSKLVSLNLNSNNVRYEAVMEIANALPSSLLTNLSLEGNNIGDAGGTAIGAVLARSTLMKLNLASNVIGDDGAIAIARALSNSKLVDLNLHLNNIGDAGAIAIFIELRQSHILNEPRQSHLKYLNLAMNQIGRDRPTADAIAEALPLSKLEYLNISDNSFLYKREIMKIINAGQGANPTFIE